MSFDQNSSKISPYLSAVKNFKKSKDYYFTTKQIITEFQNNMNDYKEVTSDYIKKLSLLKQNFSKIIYQKDSSSLKYNETDHNNIIQIIKIFIEILTIQIKHFNSFLMGYENGEKKNEIIEENDWSTNLKTALDSNRKQMEKIFTEYENEYKNLMKNFQDTEDVIGNYIIKLRIKTNPNKNNYRNSANSSRAQSFCRKGSDNNKNYLEKFNLTVNTTMNEEQKFQNTIQNFDKNNQSFFDLYDKSIDTIKNKLNIQMEYISNVVIPLILTMVNCHKMISDDIEELCDKFPDESGGGILDPFIKNNFIEIKESDRKVEKKKYKIHLISQKFVEDSLFMETNDKRSISNALEELGMDRLKEENIVFTDEEVYKVVQIIYDTYSFVDKSEYILEIEKNKLKVKNYTKKLLSYGYKKKKDEEYQNITPITDEELKDLIEKINVKPYRLSFLQKLNDFRAIGGYEMPEKEFDIIQQIFKKISDQISNEIDIKSVRFIVILSQTFFKIKDNKKYYLYEILKNHDLFKNEEILIKFLFEIITLEFDKMKKNQNQLLNFFKEKKTDKKKMDIVFAQIISFCQSMVEFNVDIEVLEKVIAPFINQYKLNKEMKENINIVLHSKIK